MRAFGLILTLAVLAAPAHAQRAEPTLQPQMRSTSFLAGFGNSMGWLGVQGEKYLGSGRVSLFGGLGYTPSVYEGDANGVRQRKGTVDQALGNGRSLHELEHEGRHTIEIFEAVDRRNVRMVQRGDGPRLIGETA